MIFFSQNNFKLISVRNMIQVIDSIPWVRCASGNVFVIFMVKLNKKLKKSWKKWEKTLPEAQRTQGIESITWIMFLTEISLKLFWLKKITQVTDSIPWVRCASGNVWLFVTFCVSHCSKCKDSVLGAIPGIDTSIPCTCICSCSCLSVELFVFVCLFVSLFNCLLHFMFHIAASARRHPGEWHFNSLHILFLLRSSSHKSTWCICNTLCSIKRSKQCDDCLPIFACTEMYGKDWWHNYNTRNHPKLHRNVL